MRTHWWALALLAMAAVSVAAPFENELSEKPSVVHRRSAGIKKSRITKKIYKGRLAKNKEIPYQVYVNIFRLTNTVEFCGGAIIGPRHVLSAAHCVQKSNVTKICSVVGHEHRFHVQTQKFTVVRKHFYPKKRNEKVKADIVIFMVDRPIPSDKENIQYVKMAEKTMQMPPNTTCSVSGWGRTESVMNNEDLLRYAKVPIVSQELCRKSYPTVQPEDLLCAGYYEGGADACKGDSGGPLLCNGHLTGVVSSGRGCGLPKFPGVYTDVRYYRNWIKQVINDDMRKEAAKDSFKSQYSNIC